MPNSKSIKRGARDQFWSIFQTERGKIDGYILVSKSYPHFLDLH